MTPEESRCRHPPAVRRLPGALGARPPARKRPAGPLRCARASGGRLTTLQVSPEGGDRCPSVQSGPTAERRPASFHSRGEVTCAYGMETVTLATHAQPVRSPAARTPPIPHLPLRHWPRLNIPTFLFPWKHVAAGVCHLPSLYRCLVRAAELPATGRGFRDNRRHLLTGPEAGSPRSRARQAQCPVRALFPVHSWPSPHHVPMWRKGRGLPGSLV